MNLHKITTYLIASVWLINGFFCKILNLVPRHKEIIAQILGKEYASTLTILIGFSEVVIAIWILSGYKPKLNAITQIIVVATMNLLEFLLVPNLLLWGKFNAVFAILFIVIVYLNQFYCNKKAHYKI